MSQNENTGYEDDIMAIAGGDGLNHSLQSLIATVLADRGVPSSMEGSVLYAIYVYRRDVQKAMEILQSDPRLIKEKVIFYKHSSCLKLNVTGAWESKVGKSYRCLTGKCYPKNEA